MGIIVKAASLARSVAPGRSEAIKEYLEAKTRLTKDSKKILYYNKQNIQVDQEIKRILDKPDIELSLLEKHDAFRHRLNFFCPQSGYCSSQILHFLI